jgi:hypothetical protein
MMSDVQKGYVHYFLVSAISYVLFDNMLYAKGTQQNSLCGAGTL